MVTVKDELFAASIRKQMSDLEAILLELERNPVQDKQIIFKTRQVETGLKELRHQLMSHSL